MIGLDKESESGADPVIEAYKSGIDLTLLRENPEGDSNRAAGAVAVHDPVL